MRIFADRRDAGKELGYQLRAYRGRVVVYALPRGGVETGVEVARVLDAPLDLLIARKLGHPTDPEYAICAVTETGPLICDELEVAGVDLAWLEHAEAAERAEAQRRREAYQTGRAAMPMPEGKVAIVVDDGVATGLTMRAAIAQLQARGPAKIVVAVPVAPRDAVGHLRVVADEVVVLDDPDTYIGAVGPYYESFPQLTDEDVVALLDEVDTGQT